MQIAITIALPSACVRVERAVLQEPLAVFLFMSLTHSHVVLWKMFSFLGYIWVLLCTCRLISCDDIQSDMDNNSTLTSMTSIWESWTIDETMVINSSEATSGMEISTEEASNSDDEWEKSTASSMAIDSLNSTTVFETFFESELMDYHTALRDHLNRIFCSIRTTFLYLYVENRVSPQWADAIIRMLSDCSSGGVIVVRFVHNFSLLFGQSSEIM